MASMLIEAVSANPVSPALKSGVKQKPSSLVSNKPSTANEQKKKKRRRMTKKEET